MATQPIRPVRTIEPMTTGPSLPDLTGLAVPDGQVFLFRARGRGVQIYPCDPVTHTYGPAHPEAILVTDDGELIQHSKGPTWTCPRDGSSVVGKVVQKVAAPADDAIPWLLLTATSGGTPDGKLSNVSYIQRVYTQHGNAPSKGCDPAHAGTETPVFYEAEYYFYEPQDCT
jgi:hypothetical protein